MKKIIVLALVVTLLALTLVSCGRDRNNNDNDNKDTGKVTDKVTDKITDKVTDKPTDTAPDTMLDPEDGMISDTDSDNDGSLLDTVESDLSEMGSDIADGARRMMGR